MGRRALPAVSDEGSTDAPEFESASGSVADIIERTASVQSVANDPEETSSSLGKSHLLFASRGRLDELNL
jgi:hypothetical protein